MTLLMSCRVAGFQHHLGPRFLPQLRTGDVLTLRREPGNRHDPRAIRVEWRGAILGYVPREANYAAAQLMDRGTPLLARIGELHAGRNPKDRLLIEVCTDIPANEELPPATRMLEAMVRDPRVPELVLAPQPPVSGTLHEKALEVLDDAVAAIAWRLATPPAFTESASGREVRLWETLTISADPRGRMLKAPRASLDLRRPIGAAHWMDALQPVISRIAREHGLAAALGPMPLAHWLNECLHLTFHNFVDWEALRTQVLARLALDPLARSLAHRIFTPSPEAAEFNWVCERVEGLALLAVESPRLMAYLHLLHADPAAAAAKSAEQMTARLKVRVPAMGAEGRAPRVFRVLNAPPSAVEATETHTYQHPLQLAS